MSETQPDESAIEAAAPEPEELPPHIKLIDGERHRRDAKRRWLPEEAFKPEDVLMDDMVRGMFAKALEVQQELAEFRFDSLAETASFNEMLAQEYDAGRGGDKGNITYSTTDQSMRVVVRVSDVITYGPELQQAKALIDECVEDWATGSRVELRTLVNRVFEVGKEGKINKAELSLLTRIDFDDPRWKRAIKAIKDSERVSETKVQVRFEHRDGPSGRWASIPLDIARA